MARKYHTCGNRKPNGESFFRRQNACVKSACADRQPHRVSENDANRFFIVVRVFKGYYLFLPVSVTLYQFMLRQFILYALLYGLLCAVYLLMECGGIVRNTFSK